MTLSSQYKVKMKNNDPLVSVQGQNEKQRPSRLSTRSKWKTTTLSSQYKVKMENYDPLVSVQGQKERQRPSRLSTRSVQFKIYNPLVSAQGQFKGCDPIVLVQGLGLYPYIYFIVL